MMTITHVFLLSHVFATVWRNTLNSFFKNDKFPCSPGACARNSDDWLYANFQLCIELNYNLIVLEPSSP